ncbi:MAG: ribonucleotide reductase subunit alpha [Agarilytica sp.]
MTSAQDEPQRLLLLFANAEAKNPKKSKKHQQGTITPVMCVDKAPEEVSDFTSLVKEADGINKEWNFLFIASLSGENGNAPTTEEADPYLNKMTNDVEMGNISQYLVIDRDENRIELQSQ